jgi:hypothetical protein
LHGTNPRGPIEKGADMPSDWNTAIIEEFRTN